MAFAPGVSSTKPGSIGMAAQRRDRWWIEPVVVVIVLGAFVVYSTWAALQNANYYAAPYLSPFYSPCIAANCVYVTLPIIGRWWNLSPAILVLGFPLGFRLTCYYYRKAYYRSFFWSPPACAIRDARQSYQGETRLPWLLQNLHRYFFYFALIVLAFLWWDAILAFFFPTANGIRFGIGLGTIVLVVSSALLTLYTFSCHSYRHLCGGCLDVFKGAPARYRLWRLTSRLNEHHMLYAWISLFGVAFADLYVRLVASGIILDPRIVF